VHWPRHVPTTAPYDDEPWTDEQKRYAAQHTLLDSYVGRLIDKLEQLGLLDDTIVVFTSDNGPTPEEQLIFGSSRCTEQTGPAPDSAMADVIWGTAGGLRGDKHSLYEGGIRVPLIVWGPGIVRRDVRTVADRPWASYDVLPTLADLAGVTAPHDVDGVSLRGWITGEAGRDAAHGPLYWERPPYLGSSTDASPPVEAVYGEAARDGRWKGVRYAPGRDPTLPSEAWTYEVYDLEADRGETTNVAALQPAVRARLQAIMERSHAPQPYRRVSSLSRPAWSESQKPFTGLRPVTDERRSLIFLGALVMTWSTWWSKSATLPPPAVVITDAFRQQPSGRLVLRSAKPAPSNAL
jgi:arylsulfatase A